MITIAHHFEDDLRLGTHLFDLERMYGKAILSLTAEEREEIKSGLARYRQYGDMPILDYTEA